MLKYKPKQFWGMLKHREERNVEIKADTFAAFNQQLFHDPDIPPDMYTPLPNARAHHITPEELATTLTSHFQANRSSGLSLMPL
jgi:hypothetical protein